MEWFDFLKNSTTLFLICAGVWGLMIGSFLNVVIFRLPLMLQKQWANPPLDSKPFNLIIPASHCPFCQHPVHPLDNIPLISFILLRAKCRHCQHPISWRYPFIEIATALFTVITAWHFGFSWTTLMALLLTFALIALTVIDFDHQLLPDNITLPFLWLGLFLNISHTFIDLRSAVTGAIIGYLLLWSVYWIFKFLTGKEGMGYGDFKLLAMLGAWLGWQAIPQIVLLSSFVGATTGIALIIFKGRDPNQAIPFGPFLAAAGWVSLLFRDKINALYLNFISIT